MKRFGKSEKMWERICALDNIEEAMKSVMIMHKHNGQKEAGYSAEQKYMLANWDKCKMFVYDSLSKEDYTLSPLRKMSIVDRKPRTIHFPVLFPDKVYYRCAYQVLRPYFYSKYTHNTYNCVKGRGIIKAKSAIEKIITEHPDWYYVVSDISKYYDSINHDNMKMSIRRVFKCNKVLKFLDACIDVYCSSENVGLPIGLNLTQLLAILYRSDIMHEINEKWHCPAVEFTDDLFTAFPSKKECHQFLKWYNEKCGEKKLIVKANARIAPMTEPLRMLGYVFKLDENNQQYTLLRKNIKQHMQRRVKQLEHLHLTDDEWKQQMASYYGWCKHANCINLMRIVFGEHYHLFENIEMERLQRLSEKTQDLTVDFNLPKKAWISVTLLLDKDLVLLDGKYSDFYKEERYDKYTRQLEQYPKYVIKFSFPDDEEEHFTITTSKSLIDRVERSKSLFPCIAKIKLNRAKEGRSYYVIELTLTPIKTFIKIFSHIWFVENFTFGFCDYTAINWNITNAG